MYIAPMGTDPVDKFNYRRLIRKLRARSGSDETLLVIESWLSERKVRTAVSGKFSRIMQITIMAYQGTVFGPRLRHAFHADYTIAMHLYGSLS